jgi:hypothetical protein
VLAVISLQLMTPSNGQNVPVYLEEALLVGKYVDESVTITSIGTEVSTSLLQSLTTTIANRIATE